MPKFNELPKLVPPAHTKYDIIFATFEDVLADFERDYDLDMSPDFQREHVWTSHQQIDFVEYFLMGGMSGRDIFFNCPGWNEREATGQMILVDGKQRLEALRAFVHGKIPAFGHMVGDYDGLEKIRYRIRFWINDLSTRAEVLNWYLQINAGGTPHTKEEIERVRALLDAELDAADEPPAP